MAGGIAHEINNPLTIINGNIFKLKLLHKNNKLDNNTFLETADQIISVVNRISQIVQSLKNVSRNDETSPMVNVETEKIAQDSMFLSEQKFKLHSIGFQYKNEIPTQLVMCRQVEISRVLINLLNNSLDSVNETEKIEKSITIHIFEDKKYINFDVIDNGLGISNKDMQKILTPFYTTKEVGSGTGLGLSLSLQTAKDHNGQLEITCKDDLTHFTLRIPKQLTQ
jgi:C4-dicarboxylate-specific signal transduction histidine kinase